MKVQVNKNYLMVDEAIIPRSNIARIWRERAQVRFRLRDEEPEGCVGFTVTCPDENAAIDLLGEIWRKLG